MDKSCAIHDAILLEEGFAELLPLQGKYLDGGICILNNTAISVLGLLSPLC